MATLIREIIEELFFGKIYLEEAEGRIDFLMMSKDCPKEGEDVTNKITE